MTVDIADPTREDLVSRAQALRPVLESNAASAEANRRLEDETVAAVLQSDLLQVLVPKRYGGMQRDFRTVLDVNTEIARGDGSAGWVSSLYTISSWMVGLFPEATQQEIWAESPNVAICSIVMPMAKVSRVDGGLSVSGKWPFASGSAHAEWVLGAVPLDDEGSTALAAIPMSEATIETTWFTSGMRGTGSNTVITDEVFVPEHRILPMQEAMAGNNRTEHKDEALYQSAFIPALAVVLTAAQIGMALAALDFVRSKAQSRAITYTSYERQVDSVGFQLNIAAAAARIDDARLRMQRMADEIDRAAHDGAEVTHEMRGRMRMDVGHSSRLCRDAIDILLSAYGTSAFMETCPLQRIWRDQEMASRHGFVNSEISQEVYGRSLLGVPETVTPLL